MQLTVVGCSGSASGPESPASCYLVQAPHEGGTFSLLLDLGPGAFGALHRYLEPEQVDAIALTHLHPDHCLDLCAFFVGATYSPSAPWPRIPVFGPTGTAQRIARAYEVGSPTTEPPITAAFDYRTWQQRQELGPFLLTTTRVDHPVEAYAIRVTERSTGISLTYSGDTGPCAALTELAHDTDLLLCESAFLEAPDLPSGVHLTGAQAAQIAETSGARRLVLTHVPPWFDPETVRSQAQPHTRLEVELARSGRSWTLG